MRFRFLLVLLGIRAGGTGAPTPAEQQRTLRADQVRARLPAAVRGIGGDPRLQGFTMIGE